MADLAAFFTWCESTAIGTAVRESLWAFPILEVFHLLGLAGLGGALLIVDLRLLGFGLRDASVASLARSARPWLWGSLALTLVSGVLLFVSEALKCYENPFFWVKLALLLAALLFAGLVRSRFTRDIGLAPPRFAARLAGATSLTLWAGVAAAGRGIGFW
jgi:hypothetical protein